MHPIPGHANASLLSLSETEGRACLRSCDSPSRGASSLPSGSGATQSSRQQICYVDLPLLGAARQRLTEVSVAIAMCEALSAVADRRSSFHLRRRSQIVRSSLRSRPVSSHPSRGLRAPGRADDAAARLRPGAFGHHAPGAGAIVGGTDRVDDSVTASAAFIEILTTNGSQTCSGTLIAPNVVMTAAHCVYENTRAGALVGIAQPSDISVRVGSRDPSDVNLGTIAGVTAILPQPYYRWDGARHFHDVALLALDRSIPEAPAALAEQRPDVGKALLIAGYGRTSMTGDPPPALRVGLIHAASPASCHLASESFDPSWLFCGAAVGDPEVPGGTACYGDSGGPAFANENTGANVVVEGVVSYGSHADCEHSRSYLVLVASERGFIRHGRELTTPCPRGPPAVAGTLSGARARRRRIHMVPAPTARYRAHSTA